MNIILFGFQGVGKSHFGRLLAHKLHRPFIDTDNILSELYAEQTNKWLSAHDIYQTEGEAKFRALETQALRTLLSIKNSIIAVGGGAVLDPQNVELLLKIGQLIYLEASFETLKRRAENKSKPAAFIDQEDPVVSLHRTIQKRTPMYESIPSRRIQVDRLDEAGVLAALYSIACFEEPSNGFFRE